MHVHSDILHNLRHNMLRFTHYHSESDTQQQDLNNEGAASAEIETKLECGHVGSLSRK